MALDATTAGNASDSYLTLAEAGTMATAAGLNTWATKTDAEREAALRRATQEIDTHRFHDQVKFKETQTLSFPRQKDVLNGAAFILAAVKWCALYQADFLAVSGEGDRKSWEGAKAGPVKDAGVGSPLCPRAFAMIARFISRAGSYS